MPLLAPLDPAGWTATFDALHTQYAHARFLVEAKNAHCIAIVKDNHPKLHAFLEHLPWAEIPRGHDSRERAHGRDEIRRRKATAVPRRLRFLHADLLTRLDDAPLIVSVTEQFPDDRRAGGHLGILRGHENGTDPTIFIRDPSAWGQTHDRISLSRLSPSSS
ncbi:hypothetical protein [Streptomyces mirabilis]|uniref:hypothetical protein n=1 Tax=Streptomyces mirabilis TaxID=68239 RepID=UPI0033AD4FA4